MKTHPILVAVSATLLLACMAGCAKQTPAETQSNVDKATATGEKNIADVQRSADKQVTEARTDVADARQDLAHENAVGVHRVTVAEAEAAHTVSLQRCDGLSGDEKSHCKSQADADFSAAKANAEATKVANDPKS